MNYKFLPESAIRAAGFKSCGASPMIHELANIVFPENITLGDNIRIDGFVNIIASAPIYIGHHVHVASFCHVSAVEPITLDDFCGISHGTRVYTASDDFTGEYMTGPTVPSEFRNPDQGAVRIGRHVVVGAGGVVLPGVEIGDGVTVGAQSLINKPLEPWWIYGGVPAKKLRPRSKRILELEKKLLTQKQ